MKLLDWLGLPWPQWFVILVNFSAAFVNSFMILRMRSRIKQWDAAHAEWETSYEKLKRHAEAYDKLVGFAVMMSHAPDGVLVDAELRALAKSLIPPYVQYTVNIVDASAPARVH
jgi:hypothetical protein